MKRLRISHVIVQPVLVWDDGEELSPGVDLKAMTVPLSQLAGLAASLPGEVAALSAQILESEQGDPPERVEVAADPSLPSGVTDTLNC